ncbi:MAG: sigma-70 family RNA polymerase sigma factor [Comamonadaceae bacterium]|nr:MAG: sigma-70 family RNA polymerase sigma factor [Comamonadaceae bacterium]
MQTTAAMTGHDGPHHAFAALLKRHAGIVFKVANTYARLPEDRADLADTGATDHESEQHLRLLQAFIARQPPLDRALLLLYLDDRPQREIAEILGISESNVSTKIGRLKQRIRDEL